MVSARACANQFLPYSSSGIALFGIRTVQADRCLNSEQIDTLFTSVGGPEGGLGGGSFWSEAQNLHVTVSILFFTPLAKDKNFSNHRKKVFDIFFSNLQKPRGEQIYQKFTKNFKLG